MQTVKVRVNDETTIEVVTSDRVSSKLRPDVMVRGFALGYDKIIGAAFEQGHPFPELSKGADS